MRGKRAIYRRNEVKLSPKVTDEVDTQKALAFADEINVLLYTSSAFAHATAPSPQGEGKIRYLFAGSNKEA